MDVSIIIVNYNTCNFTSNCLKSIFEQTKEIDFEVIVSDNGSIDGSIDMIKKEFPQVILIENNANLGFGAANNRALKIAKGKYVFYLNSDTVLLNNAVKLFFDYWEKSNEKEQIGALGANLLNAQKQVTHSSGDIPSVYKMFWRFVRKIFVVYIKLILGLFAVNYKKYKNNVIYSKKTGNVGFITGADLFVKNNSLASYDERYFLYCEEVHMQYQMHKKSLCRKIIEGPLIIHFEGKSDTKVEDGRLEDYISFGAIQLDLSRIKFIKYNYSVFKAFLFKLLLAWFWLTPGFYNKTKQYRKKIWEI